MEPIQVIARNNTMVPTVLMKTPASPSAPAIDIDEVNTEKYIDTYKANPVLYWGLNNTYPQLLDEDSEKCNVLEAGLEVLSSYMYGQGLYLYTEEVVDGELVKKIVNDPTIESFLDKSNVNDYLVRACKDYPRYGNIWPLYIKSKDAKTIARIQLQDSPFCRLERHNPATGTIDNMYISAQWNRPSFIPTKDFLAKNKQWVKKYPLMTRFDELNQLTYKYKKEPVVAQHIKMFTSGKDYGRSPWHSAYENGWVYNSISVPEMKKRLIEYAMTINYVAYIHNEYWKDTINGFESFSDKEQKAAVKRKQEEIEKYLLGKDNAWKTLFASMKTDASGKEIKSIIIETIDNKMREGDQFVTDSQVADGHILFSLTLDPGLIGFVVSGGKSSGGSGSNIREASLALQARLKMHRDNILRPLYVVRDYNGWNPKIKFGLKDYVINTLDQRATTSGQDAIPN
jgi:hypothetical protein